MNKLKPYLTIALVALVVLAMVRTGVLGNKRTGVMGYSSKHYVLENCEPYVKGSSPEF